MSALDSSQNLEMTPDPNLEEPFYEEMELPPGEGPTINNLYCAQEVRVLILDDDESVCQLIREALLLQEFNIDMVSDANQMKEVLKSTEYHLIFLDYVIPGLQSEQMLSWVREFQPKASIIVITAYPSMTSAIECLRAHTYDYLAKPFEMVTLQKAVSRCLESKGLMRLSEQALRENLGAAIRDHRKAQGLTLSEVARRTNISLGYLSQIELGKNSASIETLYRISQGLRVRLADLFQTLQPIP